MRERPANLLVPLQSASFALPGLAAAGALGIVFDSALYTADKVTISLAAATLVLVSIRMGISMRSLRQLSQERYHLAHTDDLTGLGNRRHLLELLDTFFASQERRDNNADGLAFLFVDLNHFKEINDSFGHPAGDEVLRQLGPRLRAGLRSSDIVFRLGGDEFVVLLFGCDLKYATDVAERVTQNLEEPFVVASVNTSISASIGIGIAPIDASDAMRLMWCADMAMYRAKLSGEPYAIYGQWLDRANQLQLADDLRTAIDQRQLVLHYQTQLDLRSNKILGVEALVRWDHPQLGMIPPLRFLPLAEEAGLMGVLARYILDAALSQCAAWRAMGRDQVVSVNISPSNLLEPGFSDLVRELVTLHQVPTEFLVLEVTETCIITDFERCRSVIEELRALGIVFSIDDFGAGATSLAYLGNLGAGELKLDVCFVQGLSGPDKERELELVRATIELGHAMGLRVVAEGIEDAITLDLLVGLGCDVAQGFFISMPMPAEKLAFRSDLESLVPSVLSA